MTRTHCKYCRYIKCQSAGMVKEWVMSAYTPRVDKERKLQKGRKRELRAMEEDTFKKRKDMNIQQNDAKILDIIEEIEMNYNQINCNDEKVICSIVRMYITDNISK